MIIVDTALEKRHKEGNPVRVGLVGAGFIGQAVAFQIENHIRGMKVAAISNRTISKAMDAYDNAGIDDVGTVSTTGQLEEALAEGRSAVTEDYSILCKAEGIDAIIEATTDIEFSAHVAINAIDNRKHVVLLNADLDATVGPILKVYADRAGVVISGMDGDQPGAMMNLFRSVKTIGYKPVLIGNIKGMQDFYRTPDTQREFASKYGLSPILATSFADGTKISMENALVANATGFRVGKRGMYGPACKHVNDAKDLFPLDKLLEGGLVDYILGAEPGPGVFVLGYGDQHVRQRQMSYYKMGDGPLYVFYSPYHLAALEVPLTAARAVLFHDAAVSAAAGPVCDVITIAKRDLKAGEVLDGSGGFTCYGMIENSDICRTENLLPMGLSGGCRLNRDISKDQVITFDDVEMPAKRLIDKLRTEQNEYFNE
jgi:predicted homoserine dehydrogenase-like protein